MSSLDKKSLREYNGLFEIDELEGLETSVDTWDWLKSFLKLPTIWFNLGYLSNCLITSGIDPEKGISIFNHKVKNAYDKYVLGGLLTGEELRNVLAVMVNERIIFSNKNIEETARHIELGFYRDYIEEVEEEIRKLEEKELLDELSEIDWEEDL